MMNGSGMPAPLISNVFSLDYRFILDKYGWPQHLTMVTWKKRYNGLTERAKTILDDIGQNRRG